MNSLPAEPDFLRAWQRRHGADDIDPAGNVFLRGYLALAYRQALPLARLGIAPHAITAWGVWLAAWVPVLAGSGGSSGWLIAAATVVVLSALTDGLDGGVAALTHRSSQFGFVLDSVADRCADSAFVAALALAGGQPWAAVTAMAVVMLLEYSRTRAGAAGLGEVGVVTIGERPTRVIAAALGLAACGIRPSSAETIATGSCLVIAATSIVGSLQLWVFLARHLDATTQRRQQLGDDNTSTTITQILGDEPIDNAGR